MTPAKFYAALVAFKDRIVEAYVRGMAAEEAERHPVPPLGTCALCGRSFQDGLDKARAEGAAAERKLWVRAVVDERRSQSLDDGGGYEKVVLRSVLNRMGVGPV